MVRCQQSLPMVCWAWWRNQSYKTLTSEAGSGKILAGIAGRWSCFGPVPTCISAFVSGSLLAESVTFRNFSWRICMRNCKGFKNKICHGARGRCGIVSFDCILQALIWFAADVNITVIRVKSVMKDYSKSDQLQLQLQYPETLVTCAWWLIIQVL